MELYGGKNEDKKSCDTVPLSCCELLGCQARAQALYTKKNINSIPTFINLYFKIFDIINNVLTRWELLIYIKYKIT
jgi:hypothetical protein